MFDVFTEEIEVTIKDGIANLYWYNPHYAAEQNKKMQESLQPYDTIGQNHLIEGTSDAREWWKPKRGSAARFRPLHPREFPGRQDLTNPVSKKSIYAA